VTCRDEGLVSFGEALRAARKTAGYGLQAFADELGIDRSSVSRWQRGKHFPEPYYAEKIRALTGLDVESFRQRGVVVTRDELAEGLASLAVRVDQLAAGHEELEAAVARLEQRGAGQVPPG